MSARGGARLHDLLRKACDEQRVLRIDYRGWKDGLPVERDIEIYAADVKYVDAYCRLREDPRVFRVDRIHGARLLPEEFPIRPELESHFAAMGWAGRSPDWRRALVQSLLADRRADALLATELRG